MQEASELGGVMPRTPFFELGVKNYVYGDAVVELARRADELALEHDVDVLLITPYADIRAVSDATERLIVVAPYMDVLRPGRGLAAILPESLRAAGAAGVVVNHTEQPMSLHQIEATIARAREIGMFTFACADSIEQARSIACLGPDIINPEPAALIGSGTSAGVPFLHESVAAIRPLAPTALIEQAAGITTADEVFDLIAAGADGVGVASGVMRAADPVRTLTEMIAAVARGRAARSLGHKEEGTKS